MKLITKLFPSATSGLHASVFKLMTSISIVCGGNSLLTTQVSLHLSSGTFSPLSIQIVLTGFPMGFLLGCVSASTIVRRLGNAITCWLAIAAMACATLGFSFLDDPALLFSLRIINGLAMAVLFINCESWINGYASPENRGAYFALYMIATSLGALLGQIVSGLNADHQRIGFALAFAIVIVGLGYGYVTVGRWPRTASSQEAPASELRERRKITPLQLVLLVPLTVIGVLQAGTTNMNFYSLMPLYGSGVGLPAATTVALMTTFSLGGVLAQVPIGWLSGSLDRRVILMFQGSGVVIFCALIPWLSAENPILLFPVFFVYGATALTIYPIAVAYAGSRVNRELMATVSGYLLLVYSLTNISTPGLASGLMTHVAPQALFLTLGCGGLLLAMAACLSLRRDLRADDRPGGLTEGF
ncbi:MFS transporter [Neorhizobium sp. NCHU2750]|uniref:MFS transporter n=1 Tax=Neorhizobium sp. NCHU2750 TaxID=1825976 RepID=UPI0013C44097